MLVACACNAATFTSVTNGWNVQRTNVVNEIVESLYARGAYTSTPPYKAFGDSLQSYSLWAGYQAQTYPKLDGAVTYLASVSTGWRKPFAEGVEEWSFEDPAPWNWYGTSLWHEATGGDYTSGPRRAVDYSHTNAWRNYTEPIYSYGTCVKGDIIGPWIPYDLQSVFMVQTNASFFIDYTSRYPERLEAVGGYVTNTFFSGAKATNEPWSVAWGNMAEVATNGIAMSLSSPGMAVQTVGDTTIDAYIQRAVVPVNSAWVRIPAKYAARAYAVDDYSSS